MVAAATIGPKTSSLLKRIRDLLYRDGWTIKGVQKLFRDHGVKSILKGDGGPGPSAGSSKTGTAKTVSDSAAMTTLIGELTELRDALKTALAARA